MTGARRKGERRGEQEEEKQGLVRAAGSSGLMGTQN